MSFSKVNTKRILFFYLLILSLFALPFDASAQAKKKVVAKKTAAKKTIATPSQNLPKVTQIDEIALKNLLKREGENAKPLLINFWATWCAPCVEEFPDLVKIANDYKDKIDVVTVSLDDLAEITRDVPKFLAKQKAEMPAYLLKSNDEETAIKTVADSWQGGLPFTGLYDKTGKLIYGRQGKFVSSQLRTEIDQVLSKANNAAIVTAFEKGKTDALRDVAEGKLSYKLYDYTLISEKPVEYFQRNYNISVQVVQDGWRRDGIAKYTAIHQKAAYYAKGYNLTSEAEIIKKHGKEVLEKLKSFPTPYPADVMDLTLIPNRKN